ncbi:MAG: extracellular solute-binding protein [Candidatus Caldarchaeum sp.]
MKSSGRGGVSKTVSGILMIIFLVVGIGAGYFAGQSGATTQIVTVRATATLMSTVTVTATVTQTATPTPKVFYPAELVEAARREGKLVIYHTLPPAQMDKLVAEFKQRFPGIEVETWRGGTAELLSKVLGEYRGGVYAVDVLFGSDAPFVVLHREGVLARRPPEVVLPDGFPSELILDIGYAIRRIFFVLMYNTKLVSAEMAPKTIEDLAKPEWRGKISAADFTTHTPTIYFLMQLKEMWGEEKFWNWMKGLLANKPIWKSETLPAAVAVESGEAAVALTVHTNVAVALDRKAPVGWTWLNPLMGWSTPLTMAARPPHPNTAKLFIQFMLVDGVKTMQEIGEMPPLLNKDLPIHPVLQSIPPNLRWLPNKIYTDQEREAFVAEVKKLL